MARKTDDLGDLAKNASWHPVGSSNQDRVWTDDYSNILSVLRW
jgi:hypothetical protein